jgi:GT2 family glycosyltransferase
VSDPPSGLQAAARSHTGAEQHAATSLTVAVLNYNGKELLEAMLASLAQQSLEGFAVVVVDNGSTDGSPEHVRAHWPAVELIELMPNRGVTPALNVALDAMSSELVGLFNNDMELEPDCLAQLVAALDAHPEAGSATPKMLDFSDRYVLDGAGDLLNWRGGGGRRGHGSPDTGQYDEPQEVFAACGGAAVYRRRALDAVGPLDEAYFAFYEDLDWAFRAQLAGFRCRYVPSAVLYHRGSATLGRGLNDFNAYHLWRNPIWLVAKCYPVGALARHAPQLLRGQAGNLWTAVRERKLRLWARAIADALRGLPAALGRRRAVQRARAIGHAELEARARTSPPR